MKQSLQIFIAIIQSSHDPTTINQFKWPVNNHGWKLSKYDVSFPHSRDSIDGHCHINIGIHRSPAPCIRPITFKTIPHATPCPLADFIYISFNKMNYSISLSPNNPQFDSQHTGIEVSLPESPNSNTLLYQSLCIYNVHRASDEKSIPHGASVFHTSHLLLQIKVDHGDNIFGPLFGV